MVRPRRADWGHERRERIAEYRNRRIRQHGSAFPRTFDQQRFYFADTLTYSRSRHSIQMGGSLSRILDDVNIVGLGSLTQFLSWPDFLFGLNASQNGTNLFSNVFASVDDYGLLDREYRSWNGSLFIGDHSRDQYVHARRWTAI